MSINRWRDGVAVLAAVMLSLGLAACGGSSDNAASSGSAGSADQSKYQATLNDWYKGTCKEPAGPAVKAPSGKNVWLIEASLGSDYATRGVAAAQQAAGKAGWNVHVFDAKYDPTQMLTGIQQAVVAKADGIILVAVDCPTVKNAIVQAKAANIPVVGIETRERSPPLLSHVVTYSKRESFADMTQDWGGAQAAWVLAKTQGKAKVAMDTETDQWTTQLSSQGIRREIATCPGCSAAGDATFVGTDLGPALQQKIQQVLVQHPDATAFIPAYDVVMTQSDGAQALQAGCARWLSAAKGRPLPQCLTAIARCTRRQRGTTRRSRSWLRHWPGTPRRPPPPPVRPAGRADAAPAAWGPLRCRARPSGC